jgi:hypothetical protein
MSFMILQTPDPRTLREALPDFSRATHVFLPINDCRNVSEAEGGSHWSLLLISVVDRIAFHYDSLYQGNVWEADTVTRKFGYLLNMPIRFLHLNDSPQQDGGSDCGVFVCMNMRHLLMKRLLMASAHEKVSMSLGGRKVDAHSARKEMAKIIEGFRKEGERRRSYVIRPSCRTCTKTDLGLFAERAPVQWARSRGVLRALIDRPCCLTSLRPAYGSFMSPYTIQLARTRTGRKY